MPWPRFVLGAVVLTAACLPAAGAEKTAREIQRCVEDNLPEKSSVQNVVFKAHDRQQTVTESRAEIAWQRFTDDRVRVLIEFSSPYDLLGAKVLMLERKGDGKTRDMFMYLPELGRTRRITSRMVSGSMFGTDFTYEEFEMIQDYAPDARVERLPDVEIDGAPTWVLVSRPEQGELSDYVKVVDYIDPASCVRIKTELFDSEDRVRKVVSSKRSEILQQDGLWYAPSLTMRDLQDETHTVLEIEEVAVGVKIPRKRFSQANLERGR